MKWLQLLTLVGGFLYLGDPRVDMSEGLDEDYQEEPQHLSWELGTPDNVIPTEVIIDPYEDHALTPPVEIDEEDW
jgi:hypothetical protein